MEENRGRLLIQTILGESWWWWGGGSSEMVEDVGVAVQLRVVAVHLWSSLLLLI